MAESRDEKAPATDRRKVPMPGNGDNDCADRPRPTDDEIVSSGGSTATDGDRRTSP